MWALQAMGKTLDFIPCESGSHWKVLSRRRTFDFQFVINHPLAAGCRTGCRGQVGSRENNWVAPATSHVKGSGGLGQCDNAGNNEKHLGSNVFHWWTPQDLMKDWIWVGVGADLKKESFWTVL